MQHMLLPLRLNPTLGPKALELKEAELRRAARTGPRPFHTVDITPLTIAVDSASPKLVRRAELA